MRAHSQDEAPMDLLRLMVRQQAPLATGLALTVVDEDRAPPFGFFDRRLVRLALEAALHNATRFGRHRIELSARSDDGYLVFRVDDDGPGLQPPDEDDPHATGLGTALCEAVARAHSQNGRPGRASLFSRPEGGARFELWLA